ncbi:ArsR family transcriptional regulator [Streptomyces sp. WM6373]|uniref:ArsR/SmtB family transcription factor n=1 Tax=Streptomyces TaxID=1883 RepID=UPI0006AF7F1B|nr:MULTISPECIES: helix-turn-helix domain-containing protein [unclassified Streptomyces]KOU33607.1 ArsR family transcriptional regulator [Streptomyces sp. WM6373]KOU66147.1 ArsR family transcriptional regulator [Streptomyces sp. IGB124]KOU74740.1 ArsR family transcriptional regulator [Streptomyces sp. XY66]KOU87641.1 ArsR family transcriptional regulator [Streptomyces sp. XY58]KOV05741.1 ArsR family transcriptional regulator [Streptomyces sp. XY37]
MNELHPGPPSDAPAPAARLAAFAAALADETRASICMTLLEGRAWTAGELARITGVAPSTVSGHLTRLLDAGICVTERQGRHSYVRVADAATARLLDELASYAVPDRDAAHAVPVVGAPDPLARARTCYDHFAGRLGMAVTDAMERRGLLRTDGVFELTEAGRLWCAEAGIGLAGEGRRRPASSCLDWTERRRHLGGLAGARLCARALAEGWVVRPPGGGRALEVTAAGERAFGDLLGITSQEWT